MGGSRISRSIVLVVLIALVSVTTIGSALRAPVALDATAPGHPLQGKSLGQLTYEGMQDPRFAARVQHYLADHGLDHPRRLDLAGASPVDVARQTLNAEPRAGRTVAQWVSLAQADNLLSLSGEPAGAADLATEVARLDAAAGHPLTAAQRAELDARAAAVPADIRAPFAQLVQSVAVAYEAQTPIATGVVARVPTASGAPDLMLTSTERDATLANALSIVAAQNDFRAAVAGLEWPAASTPIFSDPNGLVVLGSTGDDTFERTSVQRDPVLIVDASGNDVYHTTAAGACADPANLIHDCNGLAVSVVVDLQGDDTYAYSGVPTNVDGSGSLGGIGVLVDATGSDSYLSNFVQPASLGPFWGGVLGYIDAGSQGYGLAGVGIQIDAVGNDVYEADVTSHGNSIWAFAQGFGNAGGVGISADGSGDDEWLSYGFDTGIGSGRFQGLYPGGTGFFGGVGVLSDTGLGSDDYYAWDNATTTDFYAYGFGAFGGTGVFFEDGGDDDYQAVESAKNPFIVPLLNCAFGTASFAGLGVFLEMGGNDHYFGDTRSPRGVATMNEGFGGPAEGEGVFLDVSGDDGHFMEAHPNGGANNYGSTHGRGILLGGGEGLTGNTVGVYLDLAGADAYTGASPSQNNAVWPTGIDFEAGSVPAPFVS
ncbi:MAG TPA: hypothetical protein VM370_11610 [Candidatus Thermoplasmatota archaeon]|nr:hypothetical protein [Candidatus Thermoplasmatota archaeon]